jgi:hypothetical protein
VLLLLFSSPTNHFYSIHRIPYLSIPRCQILNGMGIYASLSPHVNGEPRLPQCQYTSNAIPVPAPTPTPVSPHPQSCGSLIYQLVIQSTTHGNSPSHRDHLLQQSYMPPPQISSKQEHLTPTPARARLTENFEHLLSSATVPDITIEPPVSTPIIPYAKIANFCACSHAHQQTQSH